ncbi:MAG: hypothetical protein IH951_03300 [Bacteroidetes bacterium]|nr:hypothetical protein [Bacteroidota bacterium]
MSSHSVDGWRRRYVSGDHEVFGTGRFVTEGVQRAVTVASLQHEEGQDDEGRSGVECFFHGVPL